ncbi:hypothetical protein PR202_gb26720 [Eleusine coracana subsp. coracana]|uniref:NmrA-like domain-containing protein n=1 Tax=Eleusine coracana subsp. coracana TaxID=191504 RepID=A0AAV5FPZ1_ELECO|nr:hypothetical protein PR202_gb26720 [Eleusine coracana subsp. coracana]
MSSVEETLKSRVLVIGGTGHIGKHLVFASIRLGHSTAILVRDTTPSDPAKVELLKSFIESGAALLKVLIIMRFMPSEFGSDVDRINTVDPAKSLYAVKANLRRLIEAEGIPHTYVTCNSFAETYLPSIGDVTAVGAGPPSNKITVLGDGNSKAVFMVEEDIATYTMRAVDDARTLNKILYMRPPANVLSHNDLISLWEKKSGRTLQRVHIPEEEVFNWIKVEAAFPLNILLSLALSIFVRGDQTNFNIDPTIGVEATKLYPDVNYTTVDDFLSRLL